MEWFDVLRLFLAVFTIGLGLYYFLWPRRRFKMSPVVFGTPEPRDDGPQRWWHIPINIEKPDSRLVAFFTRMTIARCYAEINFRQWDRDKFLMRWQSDNLNGEECVNLEYHPRQLQSLIRTLPIAVRRSKPGRCFKSINLEKGEARVTDFNFILHGVKTEDNLLNNSTGYLFVLTLWSPEHPHWSISKRYTLVVPDVEEDNDAFSLIALKN